MPSIRFVKLAPGRCPGPVPVCLLHEVLSFAQTGRPRVQRCLVASCGKLIAPVLGSDRTAHSSRFGRVSTKSRQSHYHEALRLIKRHVGASPEDAIICQGSGMTGMVNKLQRMLGLRLHERFRDQLRLSEADRPVVFVTHMEHHSNQTSWIETIADVRVIEADADGLVNTSSLRALLETYRDRHVKIAAVTSCSNVTGLFTPYHEIAGIMHRAGGVCFVDFACSAPYIEIDMHPADRPDEHLDAIYFSPHKFLGGPGASGVLVFSKRLYHNRVPDQPGGGTVDWTTPWGEHKYIDDIEAREDGGTPGFLQAMRTALCLRLKEEMGIKAILEREEELREIAWSGLQEVPRLHLLADRQPQRLGVLSFYIEGLHYNLAVRLLNDRFGVQARGGCSCAGTYGHYLLHLSREQSKAFTAQIDRGIKSDKPGWVRLSLHPTMTDEEARFLVRSVAMVAENHRIWEADYLYDPHTNEFRHRAEDDAIERRVRGWFDGTPEAGLTSP